jgi:hypothetical protein
MTAEKPVGAIWTRAAGVEPDADALAEFGADYADAYSIASPHRGPVRDWAKACVGGADAVNGAFGRLVWAGVLGFRLDHRSGPGTFVGWRVTVDEPERYLLDADGRLMAGQMIFARSGETVTWTTMLRFHTATSERIWAGLGHVHRAMAQRLLTRAARRLPRAHRPDPAAEGLA